ncbi:MAG: hypothetical protein WBQ09_18420 [Terriglobales bacterium]
MGRLGRVGFVIAVLCFLVALEAGCSSGKAVNTASYAVPTTITLAPAGSASMELGTDQQFTATPENSSKAPLTEPVFFQSSNSAVVTVAVNGLVCAGSWDSLSVPQICTAGPVGFADITAVTQGVSSPSTRVYVHQHIDNVIITPVPPGPATTCLTAAENSTVVPHIAAYQATAYSRGVDVTATAGQFSWQTLNAGVATLSTTANGLVNVVNGQSLNQVQITAKAPGLTPVFAAIGNSTSVPFSFTTCPVQSIQLEVTSSSANGKTITPTVIDTLGTTLTSVPLTWSSSESASVSVGNNGVASAPTGGGGATVIASCTPPTCNIGLQPSVPIFPETVVTLVAQSSTSPTATVYVSSTGCGTTDACVSTVVPVTTPTVTLGNAMILPATPNSLLFDPAGAKAYLGTNSGLLGSKGLSVIAVGGTTVNGFASAPGKVLAVSPDSTKVVVSDTADSPNQVFVFDTASNIPTAYRITGATAADFSPDSLKAFIVAGNTLYVYSKLDALQTKALTAPANDVSFLAEGAFAYLAGGNPSGVTVQRTCDNGQADTVMVSPVPTFLKTLPDATGVVALIPPDIGVINVFTLPTGCAPSVSDSLTTFNLGRGNFVASQLIMSQDGSTAYIVTPSFNSILVFHIDAQTSSAIPLVGNGLPLRASLTPDGTQLYVGSSDGTLHVLQTDVGADVQQITFPQGLCQTTAGKPFPGVTCNPDLVAVKP